VAIIMADREYEKHGAKAEGKAQDDLSGPSDHDNGNIRDDVSSTEGQVFAYSDDRKIGITGAVFLILNKMIGTGSE